MVNFTTVVCRISSRLKWHNNYKNRLRLAKVIVKNILPRFFSGSLCTSWERWRQLSELTQNCLKLTRPCSTILQIYDPSLPLDSIWAMMVSWLVGWNLVSLVSTDTAISETKYELWMNVWRIRGKTIRTVQCCIVHYSCAQWYAHTHEQFFT